MAPALVALGTRSARSKHIGRSDANISLLYAKRTFDPDNIEATAAALPGLPWQFTLASVRI